jgi:hypothetical protein
MTATFYLFKAKGDGLMGPFQFWAVIECLWDLPLGGYYTGCVPSQGERNLISDLSVDGRSCKEVKDVFV